MSTVYLPLVSSKPAPPRLGYALYGVTHATIHEQLDQHIPVQTWTAAACCLKRASYYPSIHSTLWLQEQSAYSQMAAQYPERTWLLLNEPDNGPPQAFIRPDYALDPIQHWTKLLRAHNQRIAGYGVTIVAADHWLNQPQHKWIVNGWRAWLDEWNRLKGPVPDVAHIHIYARTAQAWADQYELWDHWNRANWQTPVIISECGEGAAVYNFLRHDFTAPGVECLLWFTDLGSNPLPGIPEEP